MDSWEDLARLGIAAGVAYVVVLWLSLVYWTYRDARGRTNDPVAQSVAVLLALVFNVLGFFIYIILRPKETLTEAYERTLEDEALLQELERANGCPNCRRRVQDDYLLCPYCRTGLREPCGQCGRPLSLGWVACPFCGTDRALPPGGAYTPPVTTGAPRTAARSTRPAATPGGSARPANSEPLS